jgi:ribosomal-protein-alanine N-acetyltransferase
MSIKQALTTFPQLETKNLHLRRLSPADANALFKVLADENVTEFYDDDPFTDISQAMDRIKEWEYGFINVRCVRWGITRVDEDEVIGTCGYFGFHAWNQRASIGFELARSSWRQGIMTEALSAIIDFGFARMDLNRIDAIVMPENIASIKMLEKLGFRNEGLLAEYERWGSKGFVDLRMFAILRRDWGATRSLVKGSYLSGRAND